MAKETKTGVKLPNKSGKAARGRSSFRLWRKSVPDLASCSELVRKLFKEPPKTNEDTYEAQRKLGLVEIQIKLSKAIQDTLMTELKARKEVIELRKLEMDSMTDDHLEELFSTVALRRGLMSTQDVRSKAIARLIDSGMTKQQAIDHVDLVIKEDTIPATDKPLSWRLRTQLDNMMEDLDAGAESLRTALEEQIAEDSETVKHAKLQLVDTVKQIITVNVCSQSVIDGEQQVSESSVKEQESMTQIDAEKEESK